MTGTDLRSWRKRLGLTQAEAGRLLNRTPVWLSRVERGERPIPREIALACVALEEHPELRT